MPNTILLNGGLLNGQGTPSADATLPGGTTGITFELSNVTLVAMESVTCGIDFTVYGDMKGLDILPDADTGIVFATAATPPIAIYTLRGDTDITFATTGDLSLLAIMAGDTGVEFTVDGDLGGVFQISGDTGIAFDTTGTIFAYRRLSGNTDITFTIDAELWVNPDAEEDTDRSFRRAMTIKEFRRQ